MSKYLVGADEIALELGVSRGYAYKMIREMNLELARSGYNTISGKIPRSYLEKKLYGYHADEAR